MKYLYYFFIALGVYLFSLSALAIELQELSIEYKNFGLLNDKARDPLIYPEHPKESLNLNINTDIISPIFWNSTIESTTTGGQYRAVGLETRLGFRITDGLDINLYHHSQHVLDRPHAYMDKYPSLDAIEFKIYLFGPKKRGETLF